MNKRFRSAIIQILKPIGKLDNLSGAVPWKIALAQPEILIAKIVMTVVGMMADFILLSMVNVKEAVPTLLKLDPIWAKERLAEGAEEKRTIDFKTRKKRLLTNAKLEWMKAHGTPEAIDKYLNEIRNE